jgi:hypothetical protein
MKRLLTLIAIGFAGLLAGCGSSVSSSTQPGTTGGLVDVYSVNVSPNQFTLNAGDWASITATVDVSKNNAAPTPLAPQPIITFYSSDPRVTISPAREVCAGLWDVLFKTCTETPDLPTGYVYITAYNASHNVSGITKLSVHERATSITLSAPVYTGTTRNANGVLPVTPGQYPSLTQCVSQGNAVQYTAKATAVDANGQPIQIPNCSNSAVAGCINNNDYNWSTDNASVAQVSSYGSVIARNPGLANVYATLNGTVSAPLAFATCPAQSIVLSTSAYSNAAPTGPFTTADLTGLNKGGRAYVTATMTDTNGLPIITSPLTFITSDPLIGSFASSLPLTSTLTAKTSGRFTMMASCGPPSCNAAVESFYSPAGPGTGPATGFGFPIYSNVIGTTVQGTTGSTVLVTGTLLSDGVTPAHRLLVYDSESLSLIQIVSLANVPNSLVVASTPNGATAYVGSEGGLMLVNLTSYQSTPAQQIYPIAGGLSTDVITGTVLGVSPDSRYVVLSDVANSLVFFIDTTGTKVAQRLNIPNITSVAFAPDDSNIWIGGALGVYQFEADTFVPISAINPADAGLSTNVNSLAWMPDGQSFFASGDQLIDYSTCNDRENLPTPPGNYTSTVTNGLSTTALPSVPPLPGAVPHLLGLDGTLWFDYPVTSSSEVPNQTVPTVSALIAGGAGNVCNSTVSVNTPVTAPSTLQCTAQQISFSPTREQEFITGVVDTYSPGFVTGVDTSCATPESLIHGYDVLGQTEIKIPTLASYGAIVPLSGGVLTDGRKLYFSTYDGTPNGTLLHRIDLATQTEDFVQKEVVDPRTGLPVNPPTFVTVIPATVGVVPSFVAVVPK